MKINVYACVCLIAASRAWAVSDDRRLIKPAPSRLVDMPRSAIDALQPCNLSGTWVDGGGNVALMTQTNLSLHATSVSGGTGWSTADGAVGVDGVSAWLVFSGKNLTATIIAGCTNMHWSNGAKWSLSQPVDNITTVHAVFMTHLDVGFTDFARVVCEKYFFQHFPRGIALSAALRAAGGPAQYAVTSHPWLILEFLDGAVDCAYTPRNQTMIAMMEDAIARGDVRWHGKPMNNFVELEDGPWFASSLRLAGVLNARYNKSWGETTVKSTDVPGMSRSTIPWLAAAGKRAMHLGYNSACRVPDIPMAFNWVHAETGTSMLTFVNDNYGSTIVVPGSPHALAFFYSPDNTGPPPDAASVSSWWTSTSAAFPKATVVLSSLDAFAQAVLPISETLPQVVGEIGQSWSYGAPADPAKLAAFRAIRRERNAAVEAGWLDADDAALAAYERRLWVGGPEHNWGLCFACIVPAARTPQGNWSNSQFSAVRYRSDYAAMEASNAEKRNMTLPLAPPAGASAGYQRFLSNAATAVVALVPQEPNMSAYFKIDPMTPVTNCGRFSSATFSPNDGSVISLVDAATGHQWAAPGGSIGAFSYKTYTEWDFNRWNVEYNPGCGPPCGDFAKYGMDTANPVNKTWLPTLSGFYRRHGDGCAFLASLALDAETAISYGGMRQIWLTLELDPDASTPLPTVALALAWKNKTASRMAESSWLSFQLDVHTAGTSEGPGGDPSKWAMDVLGYPVNPVDVVPMGTRHIHAVWDGVRYDAVAAGGPAATMKSPDAPLVAPGDTDHLLHYDGYSQPNLDNGWHFNLHNNAWGTAFPQWYDDDGYFRFTLELQAPHGAVKTQANM